MKSLYKRFKKRTIRSPLFSPQAIKIRQLSNLAKLSIEGLFNIHFRSRKFHGYCLGIFRSGTHSLASIFSRSYRVDHEALSRDFVDLWLDLEFGRLEPLEFVKYLHRRDRGLWLEMESSGFLGPIAPTLAREFPKAKFILTIRDCYSWLDSIIWHTIQLRQRIGTNSFIEPLFAYYFNRDFSEFSGEEWILRESNLYTLDGMLNYWAKTNQNIINSIPSERLMIIRTNEIGGSTNLLASFLGIPYSTLDQDRSHRHKSNKVIKYTKLLDNDFIEHKVQLHCQKLMNQYFPEIKSLADV